MPQVDTVDRTLQIKIVYYGPGLSGKTTTMEMLSQQMDRSRRGDLMVLDTTGDRTLFFDWMPVELGKIRGFDVKIQLYTVPGQVRYNNTRKQVLTGVDGIVFVADSQEDFMEQNKFSFSNLRENLAEQSIDLEDLPVVIQYNKRDLPNALSVEELGSRLNLEHYSHTETVASTGEGVVETLRLITRLTLQSVKSALDPNAPQKDSKGPSVPMDGEALLAHIMKAESAAGNLEEATRAATEDPEGEPQPQKEGDVEGGEADGEAEDTPYAEITAEVGAGADESLSKAAAEKLQKRLEGLDNELSQIHAKLEQIEDGLGSIVDKKLQSLSGKVEDLDSRMEVAQRVLTSLGGRMAVVERRISRMEMASQNPEKTNQMRGMAEALQSLATLLADHANLLTQNKKEKTEDEEPQTDTH